MSEIEQLERAQRAILQIRKALTGDIHSTTNLLDDIAELVAERDALRALVRAHMRAAGYSESIIRHDLENPRAALTPEPTP